jgi:hypothetical protein
MSRPRVPKSKAICTGQVLNHPARFAKRTEPTVSMPVGPAPSWMSRPQAKAWNQFKKELFWLNGSHRAILEIASTVRARMTAGDDVGIQKMNLLRQCLGQMGATPADASKVNIPDDEEVDPADRYFE